MASEQGGCPSTHCPSPRQVRGRFRRGSARQPGDFLGQGRLDGLTGPLVVVLEEVGVGVEDRLGGVPQALGDSRGRKPPADRGRGVVVAEQVPARPGAGSEFSSLGGAAPDVSSLPASLSAIRSAPKRFDDCSARGSTQAAPGPRSWVGVSSNAWVQWGGQCRSDGPAVGQARRAHRGGLAPHLLRVGVAAFAGRAGVARAFLGELGGDSELGAPRWCRRSPSLRRSTTRLSAARSYPC
jgi:hypothetical protein